MSRQLADVVCAFTVAGGFEAAPLGPLAVPMAMTNSDATRTKVIAAFVTRLAKLARMSFLR